MNNIRELRKNFGYNQQKLADLLGGDVSQTAISKWEKGETSPRKHRIKQLCEIFNVTEAELMGLPSSQESTGEPNPRMGLSGEEERILDLFRGADDAGRKVIMAVAEIEYNRRRADLLKE